MELLTILPLLNRLAIGHVDFLLLPPTVSDMELSQTFNTGEYFTSPLPVCVLHEACRIVNNCRCVEKMLHRKTFTKDAQKKFL